VAQSRWHYLPSIPTRRIVHALKSHDSNCRYKYLWHSPDAQSANKPDG
jgi:hypothetical protein